MLIRRAIPNSDWVLSSSDYEAGELVTHAQNCIWVTGSSRLGDALVKGIKVHNKFGASMLHMDYDAFNVALKALDKNCINARQAAKVGNFGFPGLAGVVRVVLQQREQGEDTPCPNGPSTIKDPSTGDPVRGFVGMRMCILMDGADYCGRKKLYYYNDEPIPPTCAHCIECMKRLKDGWFNEWPENRAYFRWVSECVDRGMIITPQALERWPWLQEVYSPWQQLKPGQVMLHVAGALRGGLTAPSLANGMFQSLLAVAAKAAHRVASRECHDSTIRVPDMRHENSVRSRYAGGPSPLLGSHMPVFQHDELVAEHQRSVAHDAAMRIGEILVDELRYCCPDVAPAAKVEPCLMERLRKDAKAQWERGGSAPADAYDRLVPYNPVPR